MFSRGSLDLIFDLLPFVERAQSGALDSGDMNKYVPAATALRLNETIALGWIEPLHRAGPAEAWDNSFPGKAAAAAA
jgi:hypothetical protein